MPSRAPLPPLHLANRVCSLRGRGDPLDSYERLGAAAKGAILELLPADWSFEGRRVLDFGCGAGRTLRHFLDEARAAELWGVDTDTESARRILCPPLNAELSRRAPPLRFDSASFDLIWALSVFTHLTDHSAAWLLRLLRPGAAARHLHGEMELAPLPRRGLPRPAHPPLRPRSRSPGMSSALATIRPCATR